MIVPDVNVLVYAVDGGSHHHETARTWLERTLSGTETIGFAWVVLVAFLRLTTNTRLFTAALTFEESIEIVRGWLAQPPAVIIEPSDRHLDGMKELLDPLGSAGNLVNDAHLAALALHHGATVMTFDSDFGRFAGLSWREPGQ